MKIARLICTVAVFTCVLTPVAYADDVKAAIEAANAQYAAAVAKGDAAAAAAIYARDAQWMLVGRDPIHGKEAIQKALQGILDGVGGVVAISLKTLEVFGHGPTATEVGEYQVRDKAGKELDHGSYIVVWQLVDGKWKILRDMGLTNVPPPKTAPQPPPPPSSPQANPTSH